MQEKIVTIGASDRLSTVEDIMTLGRVRHMPVVQGGKLEKVELVVEAVRIRVAVRLFQADLQAPALAGAQRLARRLGDRSVVFIARRVPGERHATRYLHC